MKYYMFNNRRTIRSKTKKTALEIEEFTDGPIKVMAEADGYAMVRRKGCMPFVIPSKDIIREGEK